MQKRIGILTGGGDCPGLNAVIRAVVFKAHHADFETLGLRLGWKGLLEVDQDESLKHPLSLETVEDIHLLGGTILGSSRTNPAKLEGGIERCEKNLKSLGLHALIAIGGEDTLGFAAKLAERGLPIVGVPKTIDNDLVGTDYTFGFASAVTIATDAMDRLRTTAKSHDRILVLELMGRHAGWITTFTGIASGADVVLPTEKPMSVDEVCALLKKKRARGKNYALVAIAEGADVPGLGSSTISEETDAFGHKQLGGIGSRLASAIKEKTGFDTRAVNLGHVQRGGCPTAMDRVLATSYGLFAMKLVLTNDFGKMAAYVGGEITGVDLQRARDGIKTVPDNVFSVARHFFC